MCCILFFKLQYILHLAQDWSYSKSLESVLEILFIFKTFFLIKQAESIYEMFLRSWNVTLRNYNSYKSRAKSLPYTKCTSDKWRSFWPNKMLQIDIPFVEKPVISLILLTVIITTWIYGGHKEKLVNHMKMSACSLWYENTEEIFFFGVVVADLLSSFCSCVWQKFVKSRECSFQCPLYSSVCKTENTFL